MKTVRVLFFSLLRDLTGVEECDFAVKESPLSVGDFLTQVYQTHPKLVDWDEKILVAVNCEYADRTDSINEGDEIAIMPPVQGG